MIRIFQMNDCDWMAGESLEACKQEYQSEYYGGRDLEDEPYELTDEELDRRQFFDSDDPEGERRTFREELDRLIASGVTFPAFFATTEF